MGAAMNPTMNKPWAVVLAAGDGTRLRPLTRLLYGEDLPKQFAAIEGERSLIQVTLDRLASHFAPERTVVVVGKPYEAIARRQLRDYEGVDVVVQPRNLGTGPGLLLPLARIRTRDRSARVAVFPADHYVSRPKQLLDGVGSALDAAARPGLTLIGVQADRAETEYGWIVPGHRASKNAAAIQVVHRFVEKPDRAIAEKLLRQGALWNTFISIGRVREFWAAAHRHLPRVARLLDLYAERVGQTDEGSLLERLYAKMEPANFSRSVLEKTRGLGVLRVRDSGWSDWGTPSRVFESLRGTPSGERLLMRLENSRNTGTALSESAPEHDVQRDRAVALPA
jgi:mannose-1-phosphate guanylyltransferase